VHEAQRSAMDALTEDELPIVGTAGNDTLDGTAALPK
jgi:hypothetical protein